MSTMSLAAKISQSLPPVNAISDLAEEPWVDRSFMLTHCSVVGVLSVHLVGAGDGKGKD